MFGGVLWPVKSAEKNNQSTSYENPTATTCLKVIGIGNTLRKGQNNLASDFQLERTRKQEYTHMGAGRSLMLVLGDRKLRVSE
jgi:hypothetical protein